MKIFVPAHGPKAVLVEKAKEQIGLKVFPSVFINNDGVISPIPIGEVIRCKVVEGGLQMTVELYAPEMEGVH